MKKQLLLFYIHHVNSHQSLFTFFNHSAGKIFQSQTDMLHTKLIWEGLESLSCLDVNLTSMWLTV